MILTEYKVLTSRNDRYPTELLKAINVNALVLKNIYSFPEVRGDIYIILFKALW